MLVNLHVKNFAIIDEVDVDFGEHLNILTGETGAGKSILWDPSESHWELEFLLRLLENVQIMRW